MLSSATKRFILPFSNQKSELSEVEAAALFAIAESERNRGGGLLNRRIEEELAFLSKAVYPLWLFPKNDVIFLFDALGNSNYSLSYFEVSSAKAFIQNFETNVRSRENYVSFLSDHSNYFQRSVKEKQFVFKNLIIDSDLKREFNVYRKEAIEMATQPTAMILLSPILDEKSILFTLSEFGNLQTSIDEEAEKLSECLRSVNRTTSQYLTELDYEAAAAKEEVDAKIKALEELVNPKVTSLTKEYNQKIKNLTDNFDKEIEKLGKLNVKTQRSIEGNREKIELYQREAKIQAAKKHKIYEKRWNDKSKLLKKEIKGLEKELKNIDSHLKKTAKQKLLEISELNIQLEDEIKLARQPLLDLEAVRNNKTLLFKKETERLLNLEKPVIEGINKSIKLKEVMRANFEVLGIRSQDLKAPALFYVPFYVACFETGVSKRYLIIPPSTVSTIDFSAKLKGAFGRSRVADLFMPRFGSVAALIANTQKLMKQDPILESQMNDLGRKSNLLMNNVFKADAQKGLVFLKHQGWLSEKEQQFLSNRLLV
jgi:hypothetical protein